jgi:hypothetical protein
MDKWLSIEHWWMTSTRKKLKDLDKNRFLSHFVPRLISIPLSFYQCCTVPFHSIATLAYCYICLVECENPRQLLHFCLTTSLINPDKVISSYIVIYLSHFSQMFWQSFKKSRKSSDPPKFQSVHYVRSMKISNYLILHPQNFSVIRYNTK